MQKLKSNLIFSFILLIAGTVFLQMLLYLFHVLFGLNINFNVFQYCLNLIKNTTQGRVSVNWLFNLLIGYTLLFAAGKTLKQIRLTVKLKKKMERHKLHALSKELNSRYDRAGQDIIVVNSPKPTAFTMGFFRRRIVLSTGLLNMLDPRELESVIFHEICHYERFDPLKSFIVTLVSDIMWYIPVIKGLANHFKTLQELVADQYAMRKMGSSFELGGALLKLAKMGSVERPAAAVSFVDTTVNYRIKQLIDPDRSVEVPLALKSKQSIVSVAVMFVLISMVLGGCT